MAYTAWSVVFGEQPTAAKWNLLGSNDAHFYSFLGDNLAWQAWVPTLTNMTLGNGTVVAKYTKVGRSIFFKFKFVLGNTSAMGTSPSFSAPETLVSPDPTNAYIGTSRMQGTDTCPGAVLHNSTTSIALVAHDANGTFPRETAITSTVPFTWTTNHVLMCWGVVEAAA